MCTTAGAEPMSASRMERDLVFVKGLYQFVYWTLPKDTGGAARAAAKSPQVWGLLELERGEIYRIHDRTYLFFAGVA